MSRHRIEIAAIHKADGAEIRVATDLYKGRHVLDVRVWYQPSGRTEYVPTRKGVTFDADKLPELSAAMVEAARLAGIG
ncbi:MAG: transcriptional coactivator p15/PC4 family protein [Burkholderiales bacterium]